MSYLDTQRQSIIKAYAKGAISYFEASNSLLRLGLSLPEVEALLDPESFHEDNEQVKPAASPRRRRVRKHA